MRDLTLDDLDWVVEITRRRREALEAHAQHPRLSAASAAGLAPDEIWWHRDLDHAAGVTEPARELLVVEGAHGRLVPAPPVYPPGGPVLLVTKVTSASALAGIEEPAAGHGAPVSVVTQDPEDTRLAMLLKGCGYILTTYVCG